FTNSLSFSVISFLEMNNIKNVSCVIESSGESDVINVFGGELPVHLNYKDEISTLRRKLFHYFFYPQRMVSLYPKGGGFNETELMVSDLYSKGLTVSQISNEINCSKRTVYTTIKSLITKTGVNNRIQLFYMTSYIKCLVGSIKK
ncbi:TPA: HTH domain-containing protein, partial [Enterobacter asburiae]|nr:HTH domain-containing protein [Enterobacter asburiae]